MILSVPFKLEMVNEGIKTFSEIWPSAATKPINLKREDSQSWCLGCGMVRDMIEINSNGVTELIQNTDA